MKGFLQQLFDYNFFCNKKLIEQFTATEQLPEISCRLFDHILNAHHIWNHRILDKIPEFEVAQSHEIKDWYEIHYENQRTSFEIITTTSDFSRRIDYVNSKGNAYGNELKDILVHIINHATHHRGQILVDMRNHKMEPPVLDYIFYKR